MNVYESLKSIWKNLGIKGQVKNFSSAELWVLDTALGTPIARRLRPGYKTPISVDTDAFKRVDGIAIENHKNWWKFYDLSIVEVYGDVKSLKISVITKTAVNENHFGDNLKYSEEQWGSPIQLVSDVKRDKKKNIIGYFVTGIGWINTDKALELACHHKIDNARPVFPQDGNPYIRTRRDPELFNNLSSKGSA